MKQLKRNTDNTAPDLLSYPRSVGGGDITTYNANNSFVTNGPNTGTMGINAYAGTGFSIKCTPTITIPVADADDGHGLGIATHICQLWLWPSTPFFLTSVILLAGETKYGTGSGGITAATKAPAITCAVVATALSIATGFMVPTQFPPFATLVYPLDDGAGGAKQGDGVTPVWQASDASTRESYGIFPGDVMANTDDWDPAVLRQGICGGHISGWYFSGGIISYGGNSYDRLALRVYSGGGTPTNASLTISPTVIINGYF